ncbi:hypothetical protein D5086_001775 [Populus alba]|uniref:Uncharacterized protein n=1 Tax=Populus alba TaxID=43335 RepID=A0ACC4D180_POPAL
MIVLKLKYFKIRRKKKEGASHLPAPPVGRSCLDDGPIPTAPPKTSIEAYCRNSAARTGSLRAANSATTTVSLAAASSAAKTASLLVPQFRCTTHNLAANINSLQEVPLRQRNRISLRNTQIGSEYQFAAGGSVAAAKQNFAAQHTNRQRISIRCRRFSCGSETEFRCATHKSAANINSLQQVQLQQRNRISLRNTQIGSEYQFAAAGSDAAAKQNFATRNHQFQHIVLQQNSSNNITAEHIKFQH